jgi:hypothetical protein
MPVDTGIYNAFLQPTKSATDYANQFAQSQQLRNQNALTGLQLQQAASVNEQRNALRSAVQSGQLDLSDESSSGRALTMAPDVAPGLLKTIQDQRTSSALAKKDTAQAGNFDAESGATNFKTKVAKANQAITDISNLGTPQDAIASIQQHLQNGDIDMIKASSLINTLQPSLQDPAQFGGWKRQMVLGIMDAKDRIAATAPKVTMANAGGSLVPVNENADATVPVGRVAGAAAIPVTQSADNAATNATSRSNNAANIKKDLAVAGLNPDGGVNANQESMAQLIAAGKAPAPSGMAAARPGVGALMARVSQINPDYDATTYNAKNAAAKGFTSGSQGNALRSISTASDHLAQLDQLGDALQNGQMPIINKIGNAYGQATGAPPAQVFNAVKGVVGQEVVKAIVAGGGSAGERDEAAKAFSSDSSPAQLKQTIAAYRSIMGAQKQNLIEQRRAAGLPDSTMPNYQAPGGVSASPAAGIDPNAIAAELAKRGVK